MKRIIQALVLTLLLVAVVAGGYWYYRNHNASSTAAATSASLTQVVDGAARQFERQPSAWWASWMRSTVRTWPSSG